MFVKLLSVFLILILSACVNIGYQKYNMMSGGYKDENLGGGKYTVSYEAYGRISPDLVLERWRMRSRELCPVGYDVLDLYRDDIKSVTALTGGGLIIPFSTSDPKFFGTIQCKN